MASSQLIMGLPSGSPLRDSLLHEGEHKLTKKKKMMLMKMVYFFLFLSFLALSASLLKPIFMYYNRGEAGGDIGSYEGTVVKACTSLARFPEPCISSLLRIGGPSYNSIGSRCTDLSVLSVRVAAVEALGLLHLVQSCPLEFSANGTGGEAAAALWDCAELLERSHEHLTLALESLQSASPKSRRRRDDVRTWLSAALTFHRTCTDNLPTSGNNKNTVIARIKTRGAYVEKLISNALALGISDDDKPAAPWPISLFSLQWLFPGLEIPPWMKKGDAEALLGLTRIEPNVTVALDGSCDFQSVQAAVDAAPKKSNERYVIYIKTGIYNETVEIPKNATNLMFIGDGIRRTIITGDKHQPDVTTYRTATVAVNGNNFLARGITFQNTAGAINHQAVALRVSADQAAFFKCSMDAYQDTLYTHSLRQFYRNCTVKGTVDFIFGNAAAVFQDCTIRARVPMEKQKNTITAQGRTDPNQNTGLSFHRCYIGGTKDLEAKISEFPTYLGRPWKEYSRTVFLQSHESIVIHPQGWLPWDGTFALDTLFYGEYLCDGPGAGASQRVSWSTQIENATIANQYTVSNFIDGKQWLPSTSFPFDADL